MDAYQKIEWVFKNESFRRKLSRALGIPDIPENVIGWTSKFYSERAKQVLGQHFIIPDIEIYIDKIAKFGAEYLDDIFAFIVVTMINHALIHELIHEQGNIKNEEVVEAYTQLMIKDEIDKLWKIVNPDAWLWYWISCPKLERNVTWNQCLSCTDMDKHPDCPLLKVRIDAFPRQYEYGKYHVTELPFPRYSYYNRTRKHAMSWTDYYDLLFGKALGWYIESKFAEHQREVEVTTQLKRGDETITVVGHGDLVDDEVGNLYEIKFYYALKHLITRNKPNEEHEFQARAYYTIGLKEKEWMFKNIKHVKMIYYGKTKQRNVPRRKEFVLPLKPVSLEGAWILHYALKYRKPPEEKCPAWKCRYCPYREPCERNEP